VTSQNKILFIGDVFASYGRSLLAEYLPKLKKQYNIDIIIVNGENSAHGKGISPKIYQEFVSYGIDVITLGNHYLANNSSLNLFTNEGERLVRPLNIYKSAIGVGSRLFEINNIKIRVTNLLGKVFISELNPENPFLAMDELLESIKDENALHLVDFHAEATAEKIALGYYLDGRVTAVVGTHTHVQTADNRILDNGTAYISDVGMTGALDGVIGVERQSSIQRAVTGLPTKYEPQATGKMQLCGVIITIKDKKATAIERINIVK
jgi:metallophosphoesterase (TIGR00282 family)